MSENLPPGCLETDIPGNQPFDAWFEDNLDLLWESFDEKEYGDSYEEYVHNGAFENYVESIYEDRC